MRIDKNIYRRRSCVYDTVGHAPLAIDQLLDVRTKVTKTVAEDHAVYRPRSHSRRRTSECLFVTACSIEKYAEEKSFGREKNLIVRSGISEAERTVLIIQEAQLSQRGRACFVFVCSQLQHTAQFLTSASDLLAHKILLNSVLLSPIVSGGVRPKLPGQTPLRHNPLVFCRSWVGWGQDLASWVG